MIFRRQRLVVEVLLAFSLSLSVFLYKRNVHQYKQRLHNLKETRWLGFPNETPCLHLYHRDSPIEFEGCTASIVLSNLRDAFQAIADDCPHDFNYEVLLSTRTFSMDKAREFLDIQCGVAVQESYDKAPHPSFTDIDSKLSNDYLMEFWNGHTELNSNTGNLQNNDGSDPRTNKNHPTDPQSFAMGRSVRDFYETGAATSTVLHGPEFFLQQCHLQTVMCCYSRDRQYGDGNGDCQRSNCTNRPPADNTNLCHDFETVFTGDETMHCHGFSFHEPHEQQLAVNSLFYVTLYDHWYERGYVESILHNTQTPMCGCVEDMPVVSRADCSEINMETVYKVSLQDLQSRPLVIASGPLSFKFQQCRGTIRNNDLSAKLDKLQQDGFVSLDTKNAVWRHLAGHDDPNDNTNEAACVASWQAESNGRPDRLAASSAFGCLRIGAFWMVVACFFFCLHVVLVVL